MIRGSLIWVDLSDASPPEMGKRRPAVVVSNSVQNQALETIVAIPLSSRPPEIPPLRIKIQPHGLNVSSFAVIPGIRQIKKSRILGEVGNLGKSELEELDEAIQQYLSD